MDVLFHTVFSIHRDKAASRGLLFEGFIFLFLQVKAPTMPLLTPEHHNLICFSDDCKWLVVLADVIKVYTVSKWTLHIINQDPFCY